MLPASYLPAAPEATIEKLNDMSGKWKGFTKTWLASNNLAEESAVSGSIHPILGGKYFIHEYEGDLHGNHFDGFVIYGYTSGQEKLQQVCLDSFQMGTGIVFNKIDINKEGFHLAGNYNGTDETWNWRSEIDMPDKNTLIISSYNIKPNGMEAKATETIYNRI